MKLLKLNSRGPNVARLQYFLIGTGDLRGAVDGVFGPMTRAAVMKFQKKHDLSADGVVGNSTLATMLDFGFALVDDPGPGPVTRPPFPPLTSNAQRAKLFGEFAFEPAPARGNPEAIRITDGWEDRNIELFVLPQLITAGVSKTGKVRFHRKAKGQLLALWQAWEDAGLLGRVQSWEGAYVPRFVRGSRTTLSNHAFGSAFDINYEGNELGHVPVGKGYPGSVVELVPLAHRHGFYWGGHFSRQDGMHFEVAKLMP